MLVTHTPSNSTITAKTSQYSVWWVIRNVKKASLEVRWRRNERGATGTATRVVLVVGFAFAGARFTTGFFAAAALLVVFFAVDLVAGFFAVAILIPSVSNVISSIILHLPCMCNMLMLY